MSKEMMPSYVMDKFLVEPKLSKEMHIFVKSIGDQIKNLGLDLQEDVGLREVSSFSLQEIIDQIVLVAQELDSTSREKFDKQVELVKDEQGYIISLSMVASLGTAGDGGEKSVSYLYLAQGEYEGVGNVPVSSIFRFEPDNPSDSKVVRVYLEAKKSWVKP